MQLKRPTNKVPVFNGLGETSLVLGRIKIGL